MPYRFAIIGAGRIGSRHAGLASRFGKLLAVADTDPEKSQIVAGQYHARGYSSLESLLEAESPDVVSICTPNDLHASQAIRCLEAGCHVLCEKPMALSVAEGRRMLEAARFHNRQLFVVKQNRFNPPVQLVKSLLNEAALGRIFSFQINCFWNRPPAYFESSWRGRLDRDGGTLYTQFSHFLDILYWFLGDLQAATGWRANYLHGSGIEFEDCGAASLLMKNGAMGSLHYTINSFEKNLEGSITLLGEKGSVKIGGQYLNKIEFFSVSGKALPDLPDVTPANQYGFYEGSMSNHDQVYENLIRELQDPQNRLVDAAEALQSIEMIEKIYSSSALLSHGAPEPAS